MWNPCPEMSSFFCVPVQFRHLQQLPSELLWHPAVPHSVRELVWAANTLDTQTAWMNWRANPDRATFKGHFLPLICGNVSWSSERNRTSCASACRSLNNFGTISSDNAGTFNQVILLEQQSQLPCVTNVWVARRPISFYVLYLNSTCGCLLEFIYFFWLFEKRSETLMTSVSSSSPHQSHGSVLLFCLLHAVCGGTRRCRHWRGNLSSVARCLALWVRLFFLCVCSSGLGYFLAQTGGLGCAMSSENICFSLTNPPLVICQGGAASTATSKHESCCCYCSYERPQCGCTFDVPLCC